MTDRAQKCYDVIGDGLAVNVNMCCISMTQRDVIELPRESLRRL